MCLFVFLYHLFHFKKNTKPFSPRSQHSFQRSFEWPQSVEKKSYECITFGSKYEYEYNYRYISERKNGIKIKKNEPNMKFIGV